MTETIDIPAVLLNLSEQVKPVIEYMTGLRQQFIDQGWTSAHAEEAALQVMRVTWIHGTTQ